MALQPHKAILSCLRLFLTRNRLCFQIIAEQLLQLKKNTIISIILNGFLLIHFRVRLPYKECQDKCKEINNNKK